MEYEKWDEVLAPYNNAVEELKVKFKNALLYGCYCNFLKENLATALRKISNNIESRDVTAINNDEEFIYLREKIDQQIEDMKSNNVIEKFDNIEFNRHAIMAYNKNNGKATIKISTTLGYYYKTNRTDKKSYENIKKQTRYTSEFVYVYDERKFTKNQVTFSVLCPNCGAPLRGLESKFCEYCGNHVEKIYLKR